MNLRLRWVCLPALVMLAPLPLRFQQSAVTPAPKDGQASINLHIDLVVLDAQVVQKKTARIVGGLRKDDFVLYEDGAKQQITQFSQDSLPLSVLLMVDRAGCLDPFNDQVRQATQAALDHLKPADEVGLMAFAENTQLIEGFTHDHQRISDAIAKMPGHDEHADHCFNSAFYDAASFMRRAANPDGRRVVIVITAEMRDLECVTGPSPDDARDALLESGAVICGLIPSLSGEKFENGVIGGLTKLFRLPSTRLNDLVEETGGEMFSDKPAQLDHAFANLIDHLRNRYTIGYVSSNTHRDGTFRKLRLQITPTVHKREGDVVVVTRRGYLASNGSPASNQ